MFAFHAIKFLHLPLTLWDAVYVYEEKGEERVLNMKAPCSRAFYNILKEEKLSIYL